MKVRLFLFILIIITFHVYTEKLVAIEKSVNEKGKLEITFSYNKQSGRGTNQVAIWIEDLNENLIKTLYLSNFTAKRGYIQRPLTVPIWVNKAIPDSLSRDEINAFSGATPKTGEHTYTWDLTDSNGKKVDPGKYIYTIEGTIHFNSEVIFKDTILIANKKVTSLPLPIYTSLNAKNREMIQSVKVTYFPE